MKKQTVAVETPVEEERVEQVQTLTEKKETQRIKSIDRFRGLCVFAMLFFQFLKNIPSLGILSRLAIHNTTEGIYILPGMALADIIAPMFIFAIGLTFALSFSKWEKLHGLKSAILRYVERGLGLVGIGGFLYLCGDRVFTGAEFNPVDWTFLALSIVTLVLFVAKLLCLIPKLKKAYFWMNHAFYIALSTIGLLTLIVALIDFIHLCGDINAAHYGYWVTLQDIGMACLVALPFIKAKNWVRALGGGLIFLAFTIFHQIGNNEELLDVIVHGGFIGGFGWGAMLIFDLIAADLFFKEEGKVKSKFLIYVLGFFALGMIATRYLGVINLGSCSPAFILITPGISGVIFYVFYLTDKLPHFRFDPLLWWGKNPLMMFFVEFFVLGLLTSLCEDLLKTASVYLGLLFAVLALVILTIIAWLLAKRKKSISL